MADRELLLGARRSREMWFCVGSHAATVGSQVWNVKGGFELPCSGFSNAVSFWRIEVVLLC